MKPKVAVVRGKFLNQYEMQFFEPLTSGFDITAFGSLTPYHDQFAFPVVKLPSPMDLPNFPLKMPILNRLFTDAHLLIGLEEKLRGFDLVHSAETYFHSTHQCLNAKKKGYVKKVIATVLENIPLNNEGIWGRKAFKKRARVELDHMIALTHLTKKALIAEGADPAKITVIAHFIDTRRFQPKGKATRKRNARGREHVTVMFVGRLEANKGVYDILYAAKRLLTDSDVQGYDLRFLMVGDGSEKKALRVREKELGIERFVEHRSVSYEQMPQEYGKADIFVAPSKDTPTWQEQYNTALLEAQSCGLPIVTTRSGGIPENVGDAALIVPPSDFVTLAHAVKRFITNRRLREQYALRARKRATHVHDIHIGAQKLTELYTELLT